MLGGDVTQPPQPRSTGSRCVIPGRTSRGPARVSSAGTRVRATSRATPHHAHPGGADGRAGSVALKQHQAGEADGDGEAAEEHGAPRRREGALEWRRPPALRSSSRKRLVSSRP